MISVLLAPWRAARVLCEQVVSVYVLGQCADLGCRESRMAERAWCRGHNVKPDSDEPMFPLPAMEVDGGRQDPIPVAEQGRRATVKRLKPSRVRIAL